MPTLMTSAAFQQLRTARDQMTIPEGAPGKPSNIFVPWAGKRLLSEGRGLYYVGIATAAECEYGEQTFEARIAATEDFCTKLDRGGSPYWQFMNRLTKELLGGPYNRTQHAWGWSNLLKIAGSTGSPSAWGPSLINGQRDACIVALREELAGLRDSLVVVTSNESYGILHEVVAEESRWDKVERPGCTYLLHDPASGNAFVHCYHPRYMRPNGLDEPAGAETLDFARRVLPPFPPASTARPSR